MATQSLIACSNCGLDKSTPTRASESSNCSAADSRYRRQPALQAAVTAAMMGAVEKSRAGIAAGVLHASRQSGSAFGVAIFGALMSTAQTPGGGVRVAIFVATGLSLAAAGCWRITLGRAVREPKPAI
ncbi:hypothetical protein [Burkholderia sp. Bp8994]|uniref:hypothetical protein n=1 Tax=Burkholderia sp. Bp8994 TaxID=2184555 RepID=UPI001626A5FB|nr:hypothetical protein [Burkholderia sp. Bp8994]